MAPIFCFSFSLFLLFFFNANAATEEELRSLLEFQKGIREDPLGKVSWNRSNSDMNSLNCPMNWYGVFCSGEDGSVVGIDLQGLDLVGEIKFSTLSGLHNLKNLSLSGNFLTGRLVPSLGGMSSLERLDLSRNSFYGPIPERITDLWNLHYLNLSSNNFTSGFPSKIENLSQLQELDLHSNDLWGDVGELLSQLPNVGFVDMSYNTFYGNLLMDSEKVSAMPIQHLNLSHNKLSGKFLSEDSLKLFRNLQVLDLGDNELTGELPPFDLLPTLRTLRLGSNMLYGALPQEVFVGLVPLEELDLSHNGFSGSIYDINSTTLKVLNLSSNVLSGSLPSSSVNIVVIDLSRNQISGDISIVQNWGETLEVLDLSYNAISGSFPTSASLYGNLITIRISNNSLGGAFPQVLGSCSRLAEVDLSWNDLTGSIPVDFFMSRSLISLNLSRNNLLGPIPFPGGRTTQLLLLQSSPLMESLDLSSNSLTGSLPSNIGYMLSLKVINLSNNKLSEQIPSELNELKVLEYLDLSSNNFHGKIPERLSPSIKVFNVSNNDLSGTVPENLRGFLQSSFYPGNPSLTFPGVHDSGGGGIIPGNKRHTSKGGLLAIIIAVSVGASVLIVFVLLAYYRAHRHGRGTSGFGSQSTGGDASLGILTRPSLFKFQKNSDPPPTSLSFSNDHLLTSNTRSISGRQDSGTEIVEHGLSQGRDGVSEPSRPDVPDTDLTSGWKSSPGSPLSSLPNLIDVCEQPSISNVNSPDRLAGELFFLDNSFVFTAEELSRAPAEVLGRSSHGTLYKATLDSGHMLTVKWLRVGLVKHKKEFAREAKKVGSIRHPNAVSLRAYYWGPREQERLILADYIHGDSLSLHLYETTPRRYSRLSFAQRLKIAVDVARCLCYLHDRGLPHGNLKPTNVLLSGTDLTARLTDYGLHRFMTPAGTAEQLLNLGALGYRAPELATAHKPFPNVRADVYSLGVILMELLTRRSAGDIISGQAGAVDLTDWVRLCAHEGRGVDCFDRDIANGEEPSPAMEALLAASLKCILPVNERPSIRTVFDDLNSISA